MLWVVFTRPWMALARLEKPLKSGADGSSPEPNPERVPDRPEWMEFSAAFA